MMQKKKHQLYAHLNQWVFYLTVIINQNFFLVQLSSTTKPKILSSDTSENMLTVTPSKITTTFTHQLTAPPITTSTLATSLNTTNNSLATNSEFVLRQEFEIYQAETNSKIEKLQNQMSELLFAQKSLK